MPVQLASGDTLAPGVYCFHDSCSGAVDAVSREVRSALGKRSPSKGSPLPPRLSVKRPEPKFDPDRLAKVAAKLDGICPEWFAERSLIRVDNRTPASFLHALYEPGESVIVFDVFASQGQALWTHRCFPFNARELDSFRRGKREGVWFLTNPVTGNFTETGKANADGSPHVSRRCEQSVTSWRYLVLESDNADPRHWLAVLAQLPLRIAAIYTSGGKSIHALVRVDAESKADWDARRERIAAPLITLGACKKALSAVRLSRLPLCERLGSTGADGTYHAYDPARLQELLYLNPQPTLTPICESPCL